ncbi:TIGR01212 family radical SAM protein [Anaeromicropila herbilytica]|uniref:TIGR01212 family radical SAM protein n=1 Tax=Anaeromicropila herbilytica TaxID=2785025 RepID=A0A7R7ELQ7_9FIRM|nr:TIGR01212 family radical SAM protein [Anaeromicropila herbilytica]BCN31200.1 TIGR01212 family radical SAM protein [Anaeromicropila herbilytica]
MYNKYSDYLKKQYGEKVYKLPINLPISCPNRKNGTGCTFCAEVGTGFESKSSTKTVLEQLRENKDYIQNKYHANKFIAYFQNYTNTYMPIEQFKKYILEATECEDIVEISISTRPDCVSDEYLQFLATVKEKYQIHINIELGLQTVNYHTLDQIQRGHGLAEFIDAVLRIKTYNFTTCVHVILNLPNDTIRDAIETSKILSVLPVQIVKLHSLYIPKNTVMAKEYLSGSIKICSKEEYLRRLKEFIEYLRNDIVIERLFSRIPKEDACFSNWDTSWWKLKDEFESMMEEENGYQGKKYNYTNGSSLYKGGF